MISPSEILVAHAMGIVSELLSMKTRYKWGIGIGFLTLVVGFLLLLGGDISPIYVERIAADSKSIRSTGVSVSIEAMADGRGTLTVNANPSLWFYRLKSVGLFRFAKETNGKDIAEMVVNQSPLLRNADEIRGSVPATFAFDPSSRSRYVVMVSYKRLNFFGVVPSRSRLYFYPVSELELK